MARDENKARKAALAAESGALFAGLPPPSTEGRSFKVSRRSGPSSPSKAIFTPTASTPVDAEAPKSFRVKRRGPSSPQKGIYEDIPLASVPPPSSFKVNRSGPSTDFSPPPSSFVVNRPHATPPRSPVMSGGGENTGRASPDIHATARGKGKAAMFRPSSGSPRL